MKIQRKIMILLIVFVVYFAACSDNAQTGASDSELSASTHIPTDPIETRISASAENKPEDDPEYKKLYETMWNLRWNRASYTLSDILSQYDNYIIRDDLAVPYAKIKLQNGFVGFLFYNEENQLTDIWLTDHFLTGEEIKEIEIGKTTLRELVAMDLYAISAPTSYESIKAHIVQEGVYVIRCSWTNTEDVGLVSSIEFISNEEFSARPVSRYLMTIPYILPEDRNMNIQVDRSLIDG